jgi:Predicted acyltransferases
MSQTKTFFPLLQRITSSGEKLLYIDGLRFFAVISVFFFHFIDYYNDNHANSIKKYTFIYDYMQGSVMGVILFFSISGFLIAMPFYRHYVDKDGTFSLRNYYFRRLTRLEPPYIFHLLLLFFLMVFVLKTKPFAETVPHLLASVFYCHEIIYREMPVLNTVLWTLEIEIQFYVLAPLIALVFRLDRYPRRIILLLMIGIFAFYSPIDPGFPTIFRYIHYFLIGFLALDVYNGIKRRPGRSIFYDIICFTAILLLWVTKEAYLIILFLYILLVYSSKTVLFIKILENGIIYTIGGMCYSIYMLHQKLIYSLAGVIFPEVVIGNSYLSDFFIRLVFTLAATLFISSIFFMLIERPTMKKNWWRFRSPKEQLPGEQYLINTKEINLK